MLRVKDILTVNERRILVFVLFGLILGLVVKYAAVQHSEDFSGEIDTLGIYKEMIDIRTATAEELKGLPRIGPALALRIIEYREHKQFESTDDLVKVKGIGPVTMERLRPYLVLFGDCRSAGGIISDSLTIKKIDINSATVTDLIALPGIGKVKAKRIIDKRTKIGKFKKVEELLEIKGIGEKTLAKISPLIKCER